MDNHLERNVLKMARNLQRDADQHSTAWIDALCDQGQRIVEELGVLLQHPDFPGQVTRVISAAHSLQDVIEHLTFQIGQLVQLRVFSPIASATECRDRFEVDLALALKMVNVSPPRL